MELWDPDTPTPVPDQDGDPSLFPNWSHSVGLGCCWGGFMVGQALWAVLGQEGTSEWSAPWAPGEEDPSSRMGIRAAEVQGKGHETAFLVDLTDVSTCWNDSSFARWTLHTSPLARLCPHLPPC